MDLAGCFFLLGIVLPCPLRGLRAGTAPSGLASFQQGWGTFPEVTDLL